MKVVQKIHKVLKHIFIPHEENDYKPHFFRELSVSVILFSSVFLLGSSAGSSFFIHRTILGAEIASSVLIDLTNESRIAYHQTPLIRNAKLDKAAEMKGLDMTSKGYFAHDSPEGVTPWYWFKQVGYNFLYAGENLAINFTDSSDVEEAWLNSPLHRANILNVEFREIGMATVEGVYNNYPTIYIVQMFGTPAYGKTFASKNTKNSKEIFLDKKIATTTLSKGTTTEEKIGDVKGESLSVKDEVFVATGTLTVASTSQKESSNPLKKVIATQEMAVVKNTSVGDIPTNISLPVKNYSTWYEKITFRFSKYIDYVYKILLLLVAFALVTMVLVEVRKQHYIHIMYGIFLLILLTLFIFINHSFY